MQRVGDRRGPRGGLWLGGIFILACSTAWAVSTLPLVTPPRPEPAWQTFVGYRTALRWVGGAILASTVLLVLAHFAIYGVHHVRPAGQLVKRYRLGEVVTHDLLALAFLGAWASSTYLILAKYVFGQGHGSVGLPLGKTLRALHIAAGLVFFATLLGLAGLWWRAMRFAPYDTTWLKALGGYFSRQHPVLPAGRFNAGQKVWFYLSLLLGSLVALSGMLLYYPGKFGVRGDIALYVLHTGFAVLLSVAVVGHVYLSVLVHPHALRAMLTGKMDLASYREDHPLEMRVEQSERRSEKRSVA